MTYWGSLKQTLLRFSVSRFQRLRRGLEGHSFAWERKFKCDKLNSLKYYRHFIECTAAQIKIIVPPGLCQVNIMQWRNSEAPKLISKSSPDPSPYSTLYPLPLSLPYSSSLVPSSSYSSLPLPFSFPSPYLLGSQGVSPPVLRWGYLTKITTNRHCYIICRTISL